MRPLVAKFDRIAVWSRAGDAAGPDTSVRSGDIFDNDGLPKRAAHSLSKNSTERVKEATGSERQDHGDWSRRIALRLRDVRRTRERGSARCQMQKSTTCKIHCALPARRQGSRNRPNGPTMRR